MPVDAAIERRIKGAPLSAHLATSVDDRPHVAPVWYGYRDGTLYTLTGGKKLENVRQNPRVSVSIEKADPESGVDWGVTMLGHATVVDDVDRIAAANRWVYAAYDDYETDGGDAVDADTDPGEPGVDYALLVIDIGSATLQDYD